MTELAATVAGRPVTVAEVDAREGAMRAAIPTAELPRSDTSEGRQLRRWLTQLLVTERVLATEAEVLGIGTGSGDFTAPTEEQLLPDTAARLQIGSIAASTLAAPLARAIFAHVTAGVEVAEHEIADYHARNPRRFAAASPSRSGWRTMGPAPTLDEARQAIAADLLGAARRRAFRDWLDIRRAELVELAPGYEHPGDPRQPDNTHKH